MQNKILLLVLAGMLALSNPWRAAAQGSAFTYQGILKHEGFAAYGVYDFHFAAYGSEIGGGPVSPSAFVNGVIVSNGLFTVTIDLGAGTFSGPPRWLQMGVKTNASLDPYTILAPRQPLTPAPYAIYAANATSANLVPWSGIQSMPLAFADGIDNDTTYSALQGITLDGTTFALNTNYTDMRYWTLSGNGGTSGGTHFIGTTDEQPLDFRINNSRVLRLDYVGASPNFLGGYPFNTIDPGLNGAFIGSGGRAGQINEVSADYAAIVAGYQNVASGENAFIGGGAEHEATAEFAFIGGGSRNNAIGFASAIGGGVENTASGNSSFVGGGGGNAATSWSMVGGGLRNRIFVGDYATIAGGYENSIRFSGTYSTIGGGRGNTNEAELSVIGGGVYNRVQAESSVIAGGTNNYSRGLNSVIGGGEGNTIYATNATVAGGLGNSVQTRSYAGTIGGGHLNIIHVDVQAGTIGGGLQNRIFPGAGISTVGGGYQNFVQDNAVASTIAGGYFNQAEGLYGSVAGGYFNTNRGAYAAIPGGRANLAEGNYSLAAGRRAKAVHAGSFVWADDTDADFSSSASKQFAVRANNGVMVQASATAVDLRGGGAVRVEGAGVGSSTPVFIHRATPANTAGNVTTIDHPHCNNEPNAILIVTPNWNPGGAGGTYNNHSIGVYYTGGRWTIFNQDLAGMPANAAFNVLVVKP